MKTFIFLTLLLFTSSLFGAEIDTSAICKVYCPATVMTQNGPIEQYQLGTGFVYHEDNEDYFILTNSHTLDGTNKRPKVSFYKDERVTTLVDCIVNLNSYQDGTSNDVAVLSVSKNKIPYKIKPVNIKLDSIEKDSLIFGAGYPAGLWLQQWKGLSLSGKKENIGLVNACPFGGQSGSPVFIDINGENYAIGMLSYRYSQGVLPGQSMGGYLKMKYIHGIITGGKVSHEAVAVSYTPINAESEYYVIVNRKNQIASFNIIDGEYIPKLYTEAEFGTAEIRPGDAFFPAESHPVCRGKIKYFLQRLGRGLPTINPPREPLPPFNTKPAQPAPQTQPKTAPDKKLWPDEKEVAPKAPTNNPEEQFKPKEAEKPDLTIIELQQGLLDAQRKLEDAKNRYEQLTDKSVQAERKLWEDKVSELNRKIAEFERLLAEKNKPAPAPVPAHDGFFKNLFGKITSLPGQAISGIAGMVGFSREGVLWSILGIVGPLLIPGVREFAVARGVSPVVIKGISSLIKFYGWLRKGKTGGEVVSRVLNDIGELKNGKTEDNSIAEPVSFKASPANKDSVIKPEYVFDAASGVYLSRQDADALNFNNVELVSYPEINSKETSENIENDTKVSKSSEYNGTQTQEADSTMQEIISNITPQNTKLPKSIKELIDLKISDGETLEWQIMHGNLYREGVIKLRNGELTDEKSAPIVGNKTIAAAIEKYVRDKYVANIDYQTVQNEYAKNYIVAYTGHLYRIAVKELAKNNLNTINHIEAAKSIEEYVTRRLYNELRKTGE